MADSTLKKETELNVNSPIEPVLLSMHSVSVAYGSNEVVHQVDMAIAENKITALMGPSGCGKTTLLRAVNRMHELTGEATVTGRIEFGGTDLLQINPMDVRRQIGMVFQRPNPFPTMSIYENVLSGYRINKIKLSKTEEAEIVQNSLTSAALWDEVKDDMHKKGTFLSGGQQQRLCIARALALKPKIMLLDEPTSALDPIATQRIEELVMELKKEVTMIVVTHNMGQASRIADYSAFMYLGDLVEYGETNLLFEKPKNSQTQDFLSGKFG